MGSAVATRMPGARAAEEHEFSQILPDGEEEFSQLPPDGEDA